MRQARDSHFHSTPGISCCRLVITALKGVEMEIATSPQPVSSASLFGLIGADQAAQLELSGFEITDAGELVEPLLASSPVLTSLE
jgi:hypothetical protein